MHTHSTLRWFGIALVIVLCVSVSVFVKDTLLTSPTIGFVNTNQTATVADVLASSTNVLLDQTVQVSTLPPEAPQNYIDNKDGTITDKVTGLVWQKCPLGLSGDSCVVGPLTLEVWSKAQTDCANLTLGGKTGWRMPTLKELESIVDTAFRNPAINQDFFGGTNNPYWTLTSPDGYQTSKFIVVFSNGSVYFQDMNSLVATRCVYDGHSD